MFAARTLVAAALVVVALPAVDARAEEPLPIVPLGDASAFGVGASGAVAGWIALPALTLGAASGSLRSFVEVDALDVACGAIAPVLRLDLALGAASLSFDWSPNASLGGHARVAIALE